jgi:hypothetical protein
MLVKIEIPLYCIFVCAVSGCTHPLGVRSGSSPMADIKTLKCEIDEAPGGKQILTVYASSQECPTVGAGRIKIYAAPGGLIADSSFEKVLDHREKKMSTAPFEMPSQAEQLEIVVETICRDGEPAVGTRECTLR